MISKEVIQKHLEEIEYKALACETNMNSLNIMLKDIEDEMKGCKKEQVKTLSIQKEQLEEQYKTNEKAKIQHEFNIDFLKNKLTK